MPEENFKKHLNRLDLFCLGTNGVIGSGIFLLPGLAFKTAGTYSSLSFLLCALLCFFIALVYAELSARFHGSGAAYEYSRNVLGKNWGFGVGWMMWVASTVGWASMARGFIQYLGAWLPEGKLWETLILVLLFLALAGINYWGVKPGAGINNLFTGLKLIPLLIFILVGVFILKPTRLTPIFPQSLPEIKMLGSGVFLVLFAYLGFEAMPVPAQEMKDCRKDLPEMIFAVLLVSALFYILIQMICISGNPALAGSLKPLSDSSIFFLGKNGAQIITIGALLSMLGGCASLALTVPRMLYVLSRDGFLPKSLNNVHSNFGTPNSAIIFTSLAAFILAATGSFETLAVFCVLATLWQFLPAAVSVLILKIKGESLAYFKGRIGWLWLLLAFASISILFFQSGLKDFLASLAVIGVGFIIYLLNWGVKKWIAR